MPGPSEDAGENPRDGCNLGGIMESVVALRPFVPSKDFEQSIAFYQALGFVETLRDDSIAILKLESFSFILQKFYAKNLAENFMMQLMVRNVDEWWQRIDADRLVADFGIAPPRPPAMQPWGMKVGFLVDPAGVLWHVAESRF
jgi:catechol 2,3-dioxygenase-like lactoylglutathione lyase family enzyme